MSADAERLIEAWQHAKGKDHAGPQSRANAMERIGSLLAAALAAANSSLAKLTAENERLDRALAQATTNLGTIRPLDMLRARENDISIGEAADRWRELVLEQADIALASRVPQPDEEG